MAEFLTLEEVKEYYDRLLHKSGYINTIQHENNDVKMDQILNYAREVRREAIIRIERENGLFHPVTSYIFPPCPLSTDIFILPNGIKLDAFTYLDQLKYWFVTSERVIKILEGNSRMKSKERMFPDLPDCFIDKNYFLEVLDNPRVRELYTVMANGSYQWTDKKMNLAGFAIRLYSTGKLNNEIIKSNQDLAKVFCPFFNVRFDIKGDKQFQANRADLSIFDFIT